VFNLHPIRLVKLAFGQTSDTSEEQLGLFIRKKLGPFVAIGMPGQRFAAPGASRMYVNNEQWQETVIELMDKARFTLLQPAQSEGVWWEVEKSFERLRTEEILLCMASFTKRQNAYEDFWLRCRDKLSVQLPRSVPCYERDVLVRFDSGGSWQILQLSYSSPLSWPFRGRAMDLQYTLQPFLDGARVTEPEKVRQPRRHLLHGVFAFVIYLVAIPFVWSAVNAFLHLLALMISAREVAY
jgi:hypothetical protein